MDNPNACKLCHTHIFTAKSMNLVISIKRDFFIEKLRVCPTCFQDHHSKGE